MKLRLTKIDPNTKGIYTVSGVPNRLPERFLYLHPDAAASFVDLETAFGGLIYSDVLRSAQESLQAMQIKTGVQPPGFSGHNFGFSFDVAVDATMKEKKWSYQNLLDNLAAHGWHCHRRDGAAGQGKSEMWHFNYFGDSAPTYLGLATTSWSAPLEAKIVDVYGPDFKLTKTQVQEALKELRLYPGAIDGSFGPLTTMAIKSFQRAWLIHETGSADDRTKRVLAFVTADKEIV